MSLFGSPTLISTGGGSQPVVNDYTSGGCWFCCPGAKLIQVITIGGGGGGGGANDTAVAGCSCPSFYFSGGGGGQGGGISVCCFPGCAVLASGPVTVGGGGAGGSNGSNGCNGGNSVWCGGPSACLVATGGRFGGGNGLVPNGSASGGFGCGIGNNKCGNTGGGGTNGNGTNGSNAITFTTRGGGGGGAARWCATLPTCCVISNPGVASTAYVFTLPQTSIDLVSKGAGGRGGNASFDGGRASAGIAGSSGFVRIIQYF